MNSGDFTLPGEDVGWTYLQWEEGGATFGRLTVLLTRSPYPDTPAGWRRRRRDAEARFAAAARGMTAPPAAGTPGTRQCRQCEGEGNTMEPRVGIIPCPGCGGTGRV